MNTLLNTAAGVWLDGPLVMAGQGRGAAVALVGTIVALSRGDIAERRKLGF